MKVLIIDNNDSFTYNLVQMLRETGAEVVVKACPKVTSIEALDYGKIMISPGAGLPSDHLKKLIIDISGKVSLFGTCLGHQAIAEAFDAKLKQSSRIHHGESVEIIKRNKDYTLFRGLPDKFMAGRYHSWVIDPLTLPNSLEITAEDIYGEVMAIRHKLLDIHGVQFHPESILTPLGEIIISNWLKN